MRPALSATERKRLDAAGPITPTPAPYAESEKRRLDLVGPGFNGPSWRRKPAPRKFED